MRGEYFFTGKCNYDCFFCLRNEVNMKITSTNNTRIDEWIQLCHYNNVTEITLSSFNCEPTIQKDFKNIVFKLLAEGFELELRTNGTFKKTPENMELLSNFKTIWFSIQSFSDDIIKNIANVKNAPQIQNTIIELSKYGVDCRASIIVNQYNSSENIKTNDVIKTLEILNDLPIKIVQLRKIYYENNTIDESDLLGFNTIKTYVKSFSKIKNSKFNEYKVDNLNVSLWEDVILTEKGLKYFPATEMITNTGRIIPKLNEKGI